MKKIVNYNITLLLLSIILTPQANIPHQLAQKGKKPIKQVQHWKQERQIQQRRRIEPSQPQRHRKAPINAQGEGMISNFKHTCHYCGIDGHIRPNCFHYIKMCKAKSMIEK